MNSLFVPPRHVTSREDCFYYHTMDLPGVGLVLGPWDLRGREDAYLGGTELAGRTVLEIGPASGFLTAHMESGGATVTAVELGAEDEWDVVPQRTHDLSAILEDREGEMEQLRNSFWFTHRLLGLSARVHQSTAYTLPAELGRFDTAVMAAILLHTRSPVAVLERVADHVDNALVIVERHFPELEGGPVCRLEPSAENRVWDTWWSFSPEFFTRFAAVLGFPHTEVHFHEQTHRYGDDWQETMPIRLFTLIARR